MIDERIVDDWLARIDNESLRPADIADIESIQQTLDDGVRRRHGIYLTPMPLADALAATVEADAGEAVVDLSAGAGTLLTAVVRRHPHVRAIGVEKNPLLALAAALNLVAERRKSGQGEALEDRIFVGDGLARDPRWSEFEGRAAAVVGNPPYVREKGNRALFEELRSRHEHLAAFFGPRMDLLYLFFHRSASFVRPGGRLAMLTTAYWLTATNASRVRRDMTQRLRPQVLIRVESTGVFSDAPGQHSLLSVFGAPGEAPARLRALSLEDEPADWSALVEALLSEQCETPQVREQPSHRLGADRWTPFADAATDRWARRLEEQGTPLSSLLVDRQGFVSGADRFSGRHPKRYAPGAPVPDKGEPIFLFERGAVPAELAQLGPTVVRPLVRAGNLEPNGVIITPPSQEFALYIHGEVGAAAEAVLETHLGRFRPVLEHRREVRTGSMPWYRIHWPRDRAEQTGPKLVVPRRAPSPRFALDLSASAISSDCTYLIPPDEVDEPLRYLVTLMVVLNSDLIARYLRNYGKSKGRQLEFYSEPLRTLPLPLRLADGSLEIIEKLVDSDTRLRWSELIDARLAGLFPARANDPVLA
ncbi:hypothetical protein FIV42_27425 [Persicimonas caeni]|uniref:site-specific DNA-methyltransferase (adenine-specific) n=1 Tax=Persicimonas caeni TaxID=2292766 RepID=A0A4Y6Q188_PERCE|nr:N-6 DNA methylase [Persicimonas caeni]QDG54341.1 hypothetical protein FIV42_27425 [Persicimonas caeni]QED35562.1 N-6 DNA methylase [Persicimonas caeni]